MRRWLKLFIIAAVPGALIVSTLRQNIVVAQHEARPALTLEQQIQSAKASGVYLPDLWESYFVYDESRLRDPLDQGGDNFATATHIPNLPYNNVGQTFGYNNDYDEVCPFAGPNLSGDVVYRYNALDDQVVSISLCAGSNFDTKLYVYQDVYTPGNPYACNDDACPNFLSQLDGVILSGGHSYYIVIDGYGGAHGFYTISIIPDTQEPCPCPNPEQEPNDNFPVLQSINIGDRFCGLISHPGDFDLVRLHQTEPAAVRVYLWGNAGPTPCPGGQGLHPSAQILAEDGEVIAFAGDTSNQATYFDSEFPLGGYSHLLKIGGARGTVGPYEIEIEMLPLPLVAPPVPRPTIATSGGQTRLYWNASYVAGEQVIVEYSDTPDGPWFTHAVFFGPGPASLVIPVLNDRRFFRMKSNGNRPQSPFVGAVVPLSEPGVTEYDDNEIAQFQIDEVEWGRDANGNVGMTRLLAHGVGPSAGEWIDQDNRNLYQQGMIPISDFAGTAMKIFGRDVMVEHIAFVRDPDTGTLGIADGRGTNPNGDSVMYFNDSPQYLTPETGVSGNWAGWFWWDWCPSFCCRLKVIAFCRATALGWAPACTGPFCAGNPACWLGCPCPPAGFLCTGTCSPCTFVPDPNFALRRWCSCQATQPPGPSAFCFFQIWVKCKFYECQDLFQDCVCPGAPPCPTFPTWTLVPFVDSAMRAACKVNCE